MTVPLTPASALPPVGDGLPATFRDRGVSVPFTTPMLAGTRAREAEPGGTELVVLNPSGGRGVYVLTCSNLRALCRPNVHDARLNQRISVLPSITPASVRDAAREVAAIGLAGREAMAAALALADADEQDRRQTEAALLAALTRRLGPPIHEPAEAGQMAERLAPLLGTDPQSVAADLTTLVEALLPVGLPGQPTAGRAARMVKRLATLAQELNLWLCDNIPDTNADLADMVLCAAELTGAAADAALAAAHGLIGDPVGLLRAFAKAPELVTRRISQPEWLLDGWEQVCLLWQCADGPANRHGILAEMARLVPNLPREVSEWMALPGASAENRRTIGLDATRRSDATGLGLAARNERLRALAI
jgi:hypothetical protein